MYLIQGYSKLGDIFSEVYISLFFVETTKENLLWIIKNSKFILQKNYVDGKTFPKYYAKEI